MQEITSRTRTSPINYVREELEGKKFSELILENSILQQTLGVFEQSFTESVVKTEFLSANMESIKNEYPRPSDQEKLKTSEKITVNGTYEIGRRGFFAIIDYPWVTVNELVDVVCKSPDFKRYDIKTLKNYYPKEGVLSLEEKRSFSDFKLLTV